MPPSAPPRPEIFDQVEARLRRHAVARSIGMRFILAYPGEGRSITVQFFQDHYGAELPEGLPQYHKGHPLFYEELD